MSATPLTVVPSPSSLVASLGEVSPFRDLPEAVIAAIADISAQQDYPQGETIYSLGQFDGSEFFVVISGVLKVSQADPASGEMLIDQYGGGAIFGLAETMSDEPCGDPAALTLSASTDLVVAAIDADGFRQIVQQRPTLTRNLMAYFARRIAEGPRRAESDASPERRVYAALLKQVVRDAVTGDWRVDRMPKHRELADLSGVDEALAAQAIAKIIQDGLARRDYPGLIIDDMPAFSNRAR